MLYDLFIFMQDISWSFIAEFISTVLVNVSSQLDPETIGDIKHYSEHDEYEMAFELLFLAVMKQNIEIADNELRKQSLKIGEYLRLDKVTIYDPDFWHKFVTHLK